MKYAVYEHMHTWQGEGVHMGRAAYFIRLHGCPVHCSFCDSAGTWHPDWKPAGVPIYDEAATASLVQGERGTIVVLTGGEPSMYNLGPLVDEIHDRGYPVHIETAGIRPLPETLDWITLSPKAFEVKPLTEITCRANEIKIIVDSEEALWEGLASVFDHLQPGVPVWLHPEWSHRQDAAILDLISNAVKQMPLLRAGYQLHKLYRIDTLDPNAVKTAIPLGGDPTRGPSI